MKPAILAIFIWAVALACFGAAVFSPPPRQGAMVIMGLSLSFVGWLAYLCRDDE